MTESVFAALALAACAVLMLRLLIGERRRYRCDAVLRRAGLRVAHAARALRGWRASRRNAASAARAADEAIRRARRRGEWEGNVYKPKSFRKPPRDKTH